jgi:hypothetical protein
MMAAAGTCAQRSALLPSQHPDMGYGLRRPQTVIVLDGAQTALCRIPQRGSNAQESRVGAVRYARLTEGAVVVLRSSPEISVVRPRPFRRWIAIRLGVPAAVVLVGMAFLGVHSRNPAAVLGGLAALGVAALIVGIEMPLILWLLARKQRRVFDSAPEGTLFAARVRQVGRLAGAVSGPASARRGLRPGTLLLNAAGLSFSSSARRGGQLDTNLSWQRLSAVRLTPSPGSATGRLKAIAIDGQVVSWVIPHYSCGTLIQALDRIRAQHPIPADERADQA